MDPNAQYLYTSSNVKIIIPARTIVKVVFVGTVTAWLAKSLVSAVDKAIGQQMDAKKNDPKPASATS